MPKQILKIDQFHGGLNSNADPRDIADNELSKSIEIMFDSIGRIRLMGGTTAHVAASSTAVDINSGYGLHYFAHDRVGGHLGEHLDEGDFATHANWDVTGDFTDASGDATYTHSTGAGTLIQTAADRLEKGAAGVAYAFTYTISSWTNGNITAFRILGSGNQFASANANLEQSNGTHTTTFTSHITDPDQPFTIDVTSDGASSFNIDDVSLYIYDPVETGDDYLLLADNESNDPAIYIYSRTADTWNETQTISLGSTTGIKASFYSVDGSVRISDGNFGADNVNIWWGYISRTLFPDLTPAYRIDQWYSAHQEIEKPGSSYFDDQVTFTGLFGSTDTTTIGDTTTALAAETRANIADPGSLANVIKAEVDWQVVVSAPANLSYIITCGVYDGGAFWSGGSTSQTVISGWYKTATFTGTAIFYFNQNDTDTDPTSFDPTFDWDAFRSQFTTATGAETYGITEMRLYESASVPDMSARLNSNNAFIHFDWSANTGASGWNPADNTGAWEVGVSFIYDGVQESQIRTCVDTDDVSTTRIEVTDIGATAAPSIRIGFSDFNTKIGWNKRITGCNLYMKDVSQSTAKSWYLQISMDFVTGKAIVDSTQEEFDAEWLDGANQEYYRFEIGAGDDDVSKMLEPSLIVSYESNSGRQDIEESIISQFKSAVVAGRRTYIGGLNVWKSDDSREVMGDAMIKSPVNSFDIFPLSKLIEASVRDGDEIVKLEEYADRILQFKKHKMHLINVSQDIEFLEDTFMHKGVSHPSATCKTDFGVAWVNDIGCYLYDGKQVHNLFEKDGRKMISEDEWDKFLRSDKSLTGDRLVPMIGYLPRKRQLIVYDNVSATATSGTPAVYLYDIITRSWTSGTQDASTRIIDIAKTNFVNDWNGDLIYGKDDGDILKWDDTSDVSDTISFNTKDYDFGSPGVRKKIYKVYVSHKGDASAVTCSYAVNGDTDTKANFYKIGADGSSTGSTDSGTPFYGSTVGTDDWVLAEFKPVVSINNVYSFQLLFDGDAAADFEINDISIVYRLKSIR